MDKHSKSVAGAIVKRDPKQGVVRKRITAGASKGRRSANASGQKTRPAFVGKLWSMVNDPANQEFIRWMPDGESFQVLGREQFERMVLPRYFKHSNFASFVRQLNMYGWHKVQDVTSGAMYQSAEGETWQFKSPYFIRGREDLLDNIVRNKGSKNAGSDDEEENPVGDIRLIMDELRHIKSNQQAIGEDLLRIRKDNQLLWAENIQTRERHQKHAETLERIMRFLASVYGSGATGSKMLNDLVANYNAPKPAQKLLMNSPEKTRPQISEIITDDANNSFGDLNGSHNVTNLSDEPSPFSVDAVSNQSRISSVSAPGNNSNLANAPVMVDPAVTSGAIAGSQPVVTSPSGEVIDNNSHLNDLALSLQNTKYSQPPTMPTPRALFPELNPSASYPDLNFLGGLHDHNGEEEASADRTQQRILANSSRVEDIQNNIETQSESLAQVEQWLRALDSRYTNSNTPVPEPLNGNNQSTNTNEIYDSNFNVDEFLDTENLDNLNDYSGTTAVNPGTQTTTENDPNKRQRVE
ncbi:hypothetical protein TRVA0_026S00738 [Trichomonascus vanleenenianus]|uniref:stress-responsive transcription factor HSF1 n=1 Tax=Trichomonascus vanleenenianus TaxID=2268995 RepID=UPI003ECB4646